MQQDGSWTYTTAAMLVMLECHTLSLYQGFIDTPLPKNNLCKNIFSSGAGLLYVVSIGQLWPCQVANFLIWNHTLSRNNALHAHFW